MCYTGDILDPTQDKYTLEYYVNLAKELEKRGAHMLAIKDMSGLLKPYAAKKLVSTLKQEVGLPIHLHTHDTTGNQVAALLHGRRGRRGRRRRAPAPPMSGLTSQPSLERRRRRPAAQRARHRSRPAARAGARRTTGPTSVCATKASTTVSRAPRPTSIAMRSPAASTPTCIRRSNLSASATASRMSRRCTRLSTTCSATPSR